MKGIPHEFTDVAELGDTTNQSSSSSEYTTQWSQATIYIKEAKTKRRAIVTIIVCVCVCMCVCVCVCVCVGRAVRRRHCVGGGAPVNFGRRRRGRAPPRRNARA